MNPNGITHICLLGFGEVGQVLARELLTQPGANLTLSAWDQQFPRSASRPQLALAQHAAIQVATEAAQAARGCQLVIAAVTAGQALAAARSVLPGLEPGAFYLDLNSVSPGSKQALAELVEEAGGRFVEAAIMSPIEPARLRSPILLGGVSAEEFLPLGHKLGFSGMSYCDSRVGRAAATKMCRSVMIKGMEALIAESLLAARHYGVEAEVLASLNNLFPQPDWSERARYMISRSVEHGVRRAEEMREVARTVAEAGIAPHMSCSCVERQQWAAQFGEAAEQPSLNTMLDTMLRQIKNPGVMHETTLDH